MEFGELNEVAKNKEFPVFNAGISWYCSSQWRKLYKERN
jgi:hypothetical protein